jgi:serine/threonine protein kinase
MAGEPREFGPYHLVRRLGVGGMAETFEATRAAAGGFEQRVCLKRVLPAFSDDDEFVSRFQREAKLAAQLRHTNIVGVIDFGEVDGVHYMTLELVDGVDLRSLLKSSPSEKLSPDTVAMIGMDLAHALEHAHGSLVHRDISPSNILLSRSGEAKLADFGIAKAIDNAAATASRSAKGKIPYMSPEHMRGETTDGRADLFSLGVVLFEAVAGVRPFDGAHDVETMQKILDGDRRSLADVAGDVPASLREVIERLIEVDPDARTPSATRLIEELATVAPSPNVRRELAATVEGLRGGSKARLHVRAREEERDTELSRPPSLGPPLAEEETAPPPGRSRKTGRALMLASALVASLVGAVTGTQWLEQRAQVPASVAASVPASVPETVSPSVPASVPASVPETVSPTPLEPVRAARGWLRVVVQPWGNVWIDGTWMGRAPVKARLTKGRHVIEVGRDLPSRKRIIRIEPGTRKEIELSLAE